MEKKSINYYMRVLHRDLGFLAIGFTIIFGLSGIVLIYRDTDFLKQEKQIEKQLSPNMEESELGMTLRIRNFEVEKTDNNIVYFKNGTYNKTTGIANYSEKSLPEFFNKINSFHKASSGKVTHWGSVIFGIVLLFLAVSSFWMFKLSSKQFKRSLILSGVGLILAIVLLFL